MVGLTVLSVSIWSSVSESGAGKSSGMLAPGFDG